MSPTQILQQAIDDGAFNGTEPKKYGKFAASWDAAKGVVAIADSAGWWWITATELKAISIQYESDQKAIAELAEWAAKCRNEARAEMEAVNELQIMTREEKRIAIAQACGWTLRHDEERQSCALIDPKGAIEAQSCSPGGDWWLRISWALPNYFGSLDAMHKAERVMTNAQWWDWEKVAAKMAKSRGITPLTIWIAQMSAEKRAEAFGLALGLWKEGV